MCECSVVNLLKFFISIDSLLFASALGDEKSDISERKCMLKIPVNMARSKLPPPPLRNQNTWTEAGIHVMLLLMKSYPPL